jgi:hypothetical protein
MMLNPKRKGAFPRVIDYFIGLRDQSPYWRLQAVAWGIILIVFVGSGVLFSVLALSAVFGGGSVSYQAMGSPGPVVFRHYTHMWFMEGKYKECKICHNKIFATQKYGTFVFRALQDTPARKVRIGLDTSTLFVPAQQGIAMTERNLSAGLTALAVIRPNRVLIFVTRFYREVEK